jgi:hypothetical protein
MLTKSCSNCYSEIKVNSEHTVLAICPHCKKCVKPIITKIISTKESLIDIDPFFTEEEYQKYLKC